VRALGTTGLTRSAVLPDVPTIAEAGLPGYEATIWLGVMAPAEFDTYLRGDIEKWAKLIHTAGIKAQ
jgi:tripartite-type tricarboxylate transporter receptor subunit TctC